MSIGIVKPLLNCFKKYQSRSYFRYFNQKVEMYWFYDSVFKKMFKEIFKNI